MSALGKFGDRLAELAKYGRVVIAMSPNGWSTEIEVDGFVVGSAEALTINTATGLLLEHMRNKPLSDCPHGKFKIASSEEAEEAATSLTRKNLRNPRPENRTAARAYQCPHCSSWHLTSTPIRGHQ